MSNISLVIALISFSLAQGWSGDGHRVIARIASEFLRSSGKHFVAEHLTEGDISRVERSLIDHSTYADSIAWSDELHFSHTPYRACAPFEVDRDCPVVGGARRCIVTAISNYTIRASDVGLSAEERGQAIKFLIHLVGDIHNPLHVGFEHDLGGNRIDLSYPPEKSLHNVWDYVLVNRKQVEYGVYKENDEEDAEPWKLSESLLQDFMDVKQSHPFLLNLELDSVASEEAARNVAASMASETALQFTCEWAYQNERNDWIETDHSLTETYLSSRSEISMELLKMAGIRLAEILNNIGKLYATRKHELAEGRRAMKIGSESVAPTSNRYLVIEMSMIPDEHLFNEDFEENEIPLPAVFKEDNPPEKAESGKLSSHMKKKLRKKRAKYMFEGVDLTSVVLIKRRGCYVVTGAKLAKAAMVSYRSSAAVTVRFADGNEEVFNFDSALFGGKVFSETLIRLALMRINNIPLESLIPETSPADSSVSSFTVIKESIAPFDGQIQANDKRQVIFSVGPLSIIPERGVVLSKRGKEKALQKRKKELKDWEMILDHVPTEVELVELRIKENTNHICFLRIGHVMLFVHKKNLEDPSTPMVKTNQFKVFVPVGDEEEELMIILLVDNDIVDGDVYDNTFELLFEAQLQNSATCRASLKKRPTLTQEFTEVNSLLFGNDYDRPRLISHIKYFTIFSVEGFKYSKVHWSMHAASDNGKVS